MGIFSWLRKKLTPVVPVGPPAPCGQDAAHYFYGQGTCPHCFERRLRRAKERERLQAEKQAEQLAAKIVEKMKQEGLLVSQKEVE